MADFTRVDAPQVYRAGDAVLDVAGHLDRLGAGIRPWEAALEGAVTGSLVCDTAVGTTAGHWRGALEQLADEVRRHATDLRRTADDYQATDAQAAAHLRTFE